MTKKSAREKKVIIRIVLIVLAVVVLAAGLKIYEDVFAGNVREESNNHYLYYYTHVSFDENMQRIRQQRVLKNTDAFKRIVELTGYSDMLKPGRYRLTSHTSNLALLRMLVSGSQQPLDVTFKYAERKKDLAAFWGKQLEADSNRIVELLSTDSVIDTIGLDTAQSILLFIPNTYNFYWNTSAEKLVQRMLTEYRVFWDSTRTAKTEQLHLSKAQVGILASIVQKETSKTDEMPIVAGVYYNRLMRRMPLQADPTIVYALNDRSVRRISGTMLDIVSPYNTYRNKGLPPGPICIPSVQAVDAVLNLQRHNYLYFCAREDFSGYHNFASNFLQHQ